MLGGEPTLIKEKTLINSQPQITISIDASLEGWGAYCQGQKTGGPWTSQEKKDHINVLELRAVKYAILTFSRLHPKGQSIHIQMDSIVVLSYLVKMRGTRNKYLTVLSQEIWDYLLSKEITITAEYLPGLLNVEADTQSRTVKDASEWKLNPRIFQKICKYRGTPEIDLFASRISHQLPTYISWKLGPYSQGRDAFQISWINKKGYAFAPFCLIGRVLENTQSDQATLIVVTPGCQTQSWYPLLLQMSIKNPLLLPSIPDLLTGPNKQNHQ